MHSTPDKSVSDDSAERPNQPATPPADATDVNTSKRAADRFQIFESVALERLQAGSDSTKPAAFLPLPVRLTAIAAAAIAGIGVVWSLLARVPVQVNGTAAIVPSSGMSTLVAPTSGHLRYQVSGLGVNILTAAQQRNNALLGDFWRLEAGAFTSSVSAVNNLDTLINAALASIHTEYGCVASGRLRLSPRAVRLDSPRHAPLRPSQAFLAWGVVAPTRTVEGAREQRARLRMPRSFVRSEWP